MSLGEVSSIVLPEHPHADDATVERVRAATGAADALVAVGSGTINDLCKYASARDGKPYVVFGTAPSMNGYTSLNAAITVHGHKKSLPAQAPVGAFLDLSILAAAPVRMIRSGLGDSLCRADRAGRLAAVAPAVRPALSHHAVRPAGGGRAGAVRVGGGAGERRPRCHGEAGAHAAAVGLRHRDLRQLPARQPGRASDQPLRRHAARCRAGPSPSTASRSA